MFLLIIVSCLFLLLVAPETASALQIHPAPEGLYVHQIAHAFFIFSMGSLAFWLQKRRLVVIKGWRYIQMSCLFFVLWNIEAMAGHVIDHRMDPHAFMGTGWKAALIVDKAIVPYLYYFLKMDHLICLPAIILLFFGLKHLKQGYGGSNP